MDLTPNELHLLLRAIDNKLYTLEASPGSGHGTRQSIIKEYLDLEKKLKSVQSR